MSTKQKTILLLVTIIILLIVSVSIKFSEDKPNEELTEDYTLISAKKDIKIGLINNDKVIFKKANMYFFHTNQDEYTFNYLLMSQWNNDKNGFYHMYQFYNELIVKNKLYSHSYLKNISLYNLAKAHETGFEVFESELILIRDNNGEILSSNFFLDELKTHR